MCDLMAIVRQRWPLIEARSLPAFFSLSKQLFFEKRDGDENTGGWEGGLILNDLGFAHETLLKINRLRSGASPSRFKNSPHSISKL